MKRAISVVTLLVLASVAGGLAGCIGDDAQSIAGTVDEPEAWAPYGTTERLDGNVSVEEDSSAWRADRRVTFTNGAGNATALDAVLTSANGNLQVTGWSNGSFQLTVDIWARGGSENQARQALESVDVVYSDDMVGDQLRMAADVQARPDLLDLVLLIFFANTQYGASMHLQVPWDLVADLQLRTTNGAIGVGGLSGGTIEAQSANGAIGVLGSWDNLSIGTTNGAIVVRTQSSASGTYDLQTSNGPIDLSVDDGDSHGFDVTADTSNASIVINLRDTQQISDAHDEHVRTNGYNGKPIQTAVGLSTSNGAVSVTGRG